MKKRLIGGLCLVFCLSLLLSSCAAGLPGSELVSAVSEGVGGFATKLGNLFFKQAPLIIDGTCSFELKTDATASIDVKLATDSLCNAVLSKTGLDLRTRRTTTKKLYISTDKEQFSSLSNKLSAAEFYIGFQGEDLVIFATNDVMLVSALSYFQKTYVEAANANAGEGYLYVQQGMDYRSPTLPLRTEEYTLVYSFNAGEQHTQIIASFHATMLSTTGVRLLMKDDFVAANSERELLIGHPNRPECKDILENLAVDDYYIGVVGQKILVLAKTNHMLQKALQEFIATFISSSNASFSLEEEAMSAPAYLDRLYADRHLLLADMEEAKAVVIYPANAGKVIKNAITDLCDRYKQLTNRELHFYTDAQMKKPGKDTIEILIGDTNRTISKSTKALLPQGGWSISVQEGSLVVVGSGENTLRVAINQLINQITTITLRFSDNGIYDMYGIITGVNRVLPIPLDYNVSGRTVPDVITLSGYTYINSRTYAFYQDNCSQTDFNHYLSRLQKAAYARISEDELLFLNTELKEQALVTYVDGRLRIEVTQVRI